MLHRSEHADEVGERRRGGVEEPAAMAQSLSTSGARSRQRTAMVRWWDIPECAMRKKKVRRIVDFCYSPDSIT
jgi:hypothetical protein